LAGRRSGDLFKHVSSLFRLGTLTGVSDAQLLERFVAGRDEAGEAAFRALVERHGPMVLRVCQSVLGNRHDTEDAFQVTFQVLARNAGSIRKQGSLGSWLHGVAHHVALRTLTAARRRRAREMKVAKGTEMAAASPQPGADRSDLTAAIHQEITRLPAKYRAPIVLCYLEGLTHDQAASELGWPVGTVRGRLARARDLLRTRLTRCGLTLSAGLVSVGALPETASAALPAALVEATVRAVLGSEVAGALTRTAAALLPAVLRTMALARLVKLAAPLVIIAIVAGGAAMLAYSGRTKLSGERTSIAKIQVVPPTAPPEPHQAATLQPEDGNETPKKAVSRLVEQLEQHPVLPSTAANRLALYMIDVENGDVTLIADQPDPGLVRCGSPEWSHDGKRIIYDAMPMNEVPLTHLKMIELVNGRLELTDLGLGNCPTFSPADDRIAFLNNSSEGGDEVGVWLMQADGSQPRVLGGYGRPKWSPDSRQFLIVNFNKPRDLSLMDVRPEKSGPLQIAGQNIFWEPSWAGDESIVAAIGADAPDTIALIDVREPDHPNIKEVLWRNGKGLDVKPFYPVYSAGTRRCVFVGVDASGQALYSFRHGQPDPPRRLESDGHDHLLQDLASSPDGRYILFTSDRPVRGQRRVAPGDIIPESRATSSERFVPFRLKQNTLPITRSR
jgi:RNA polymerase sigma factor (sigma-70 family)